MHYRCHARPFWTVQNTPCRVTGEVREVRRVSYLGKEELASSLINVTPSET